MAKNPKSLKLYRKAESALIASIEIYNKPDFQYREETFAILALNAWELLLKAKLLYEHRNSLQCLRVYEPRQTRQGKPSKKKYLKRNRAGNPHTIALSQTIAALQSVSTPLDPEIRNNLDALTEIRDNSVHYLNTSNGLAQRVLEIGTAAVKNFVELAKRWFQEDLSRYHLFLMPIGFVPAHSVAGITKLPKEERNLFEYLSSIAASQGDSDFDTALTVGVSIKRVGASAENIAVVLDKDDPSAIRITLTEEQIRKRYSWDYKELTLRLRDRYSDFKVNELYHKLRKSLESDERFAHERHLDPDSPLTLKKRFYDPNIVRQFDSHYTLRQLS